MHKRSLLGMLLTLLFAGGLVPVVAAIRNPQVREQFLGHFQAGEDAFSRHDYLGAIGQFQQALQLQPTQLRPRFRLGQALFSLQRYPEGVKEFQTILSAYPNNISARIYLARSLVAMSQAEMARPHLEWVLQVQPEHTEARQLLQTLVVPSVAPPTVAVNDDGRERVPAGFQPLPVRAAPAHEDPGAMTTRQLSPTPPQQAQAIPQHQRPERKSPPDVRPSPTWQVAEFLKQARSSYGVDLAYGKYCLEKDDLLTAQKHLDAAEKVAARSRETRKFLEVQVHKSLLHLYQADLRQFGEQLLRLQPLLSKETYTSFLDIFNQGQQATSSLDLSRLIGGVAMGAEHFAVAARILADVWLARPDDTLAGQMLAEAQLNIDDFAGAERTYLHLAQAAPKDPEVAINLGRFYLTARFQPEAARRYVNWAASLAPQDSRIPLLQALLDYSEGKIQVGLTRLRKSRAAVQDPGFQALCDRIIADGEAAFNGKNPDLMDFRRILALPGSPHATTDSARLRGERYLKRGSYFLALKEFVRSKDLAEIGRTYLGISSYLWNLGERDSSTLAAQYGLKALEDALRRSRVDSIETRSQGSRAHLYLALYQLERGHPEKAHQQATMGLQQQPAPETRRRLTAVLGVSARPEAQEKMSGTSSERGS